MVVETATSSASVAVVVNDLVEKIEIYSTLKYKIGAQLRLWDKVVC